MVFIGSNDRVYRSARKQEGFIIGACHTLNYLRNIPLQTMSQVSSDMGETEDERESAPLVVEAESKQLDTSPLLAATDALDYWLQTTNRQDPTLMQAILLAPPTLHLQSNETPSLNSTSPIANHRSMYTSKTVLKVNGNLQRNGCKVD